MLLLSLHVTLQVACFRRPHSPYLLGAILPVLKAIKALGKTASSGKRAIGEAAALATRLQVVGACRVSFEGFIRGSSRVQAVP